MSPSEVPVLIECQKSEASYQANEYICNKPLQGKKVCGNQRLHGRIHCDTLQLAKVEVAREGGCV